MTAKFFAYILIICAFSACGFLMSIDNAGKIKNSYAYFDFICNLRDKISIWQLPLTKIYECAEIEELSSLGFYERLRSDGLEIAYTSIESKLIFNPSHIDFCRTLGTMPLSETVKLCDEEIKNLQRELGQKKETSEKKSKLYPALGILAGLAAVILML